MKFTSLKQTLRKQIDNVYLISGEDRFLQDKSISLIKQFAVENFVDMNESIYNDENINVQQMIEEAQTLPFMSKYRFILMRDCFNKLPEADKRMIIDYIKSPVKTTVFVFANDEKNDFLKKVEQYAVEIDCSFLDMNTLNAIVPAMIKEQGKQITTNALSKLIEYCACDLGRIENEIVKLSSYCADEIIKPEDIENNVAKTIDYETYLLANAICEKNTENALTIYKHIMQQKGSTQYVLGILGNFLRRYFYLHATKNDKSLCLQNFKINDSTYQMFLKRSTKLKKVELMNSIEKVLEADYSIKAGLQTEDNALYNLIIYLTTKL